MDIGLVLVLGILVAILLVFFLSGLRLIRDDEVGILIKKMFGNKMPDGQIIARKGEIGIQAKTLMPGLYWRNPITWRIIKDSTTDIDPDEIGNIESVDGEPIPKGRLLGDEIECNQFQDAVAFLENGGKKGPQVAILRPGTYRINTKVFTVTRKKATSISKKKIGVVVALDGIPLPPGYIVAPKPKETKPHKFFQDGQAFLDSEGYRGPQLDTLQPGEYYINPLLFKVEEHDVAEVPPGYVAVLRSNVGKELERDEKVPVEVSESPDFKQVIHEDVETLLILDRNTRGIWREPVAPGVYNLNPIAFDAFFVPTSAVTIDWAASTEIRTEHIVSSDVAKLQEERIKREKSLETEKATEFFKFSQLKVTSTDGFTLDVDVRMVIRIKPEHAAYIIARFGSVSNLIEQIVHPLIDSSFRNKAGEKKAIDFVRSRTELQREALEKAHGEFAQYHVEAQNLLIAYIDVDKSLLDTQTKKEIALQQQTQYVEEAKAESERIQVQERKARADKQPDVVAAKLAIDIATDKAEAARKEASGLGDAMKIKAKGEAEAIEMVGKATATAYEAKAKVVGPERLAVIEVVKDVGEKQVKITPEVMVSGGDGGQLGTLFSAWLAMALKKTETSTEIKS